MLVFPRALSHFFLSVPPLCAYNVDISHTDGTPWEVIIACKGDKCQFSETSYENKCNVIGYFTTDSIKEKSGKCTLGYNSKGREYIDRSGSTYGMLIFRIQIPCISFGDFAQQTIKFTSFLKSIRTVVILEATREGSEGACSSARGGQSGEEYRVKAKINGGGVLELLFSDDEGETFYNKGQERLAIKIP